MSLRNSLCLRLSVLAGCFAVVGFGQVDTGVLSGHVYDNTRAVIPGAQVKVLNVGTNYQLNLETNAAGLYISPPLQPGTYRIEAAVQGFRPAAKQIELHLSERLAVDFTLELGAVTETVEVQALGPVLQTETVTLSTQRSESEVKELPNLTRTFVELMRFAPGVVPGQPQITEVPLSAARGNTATSVNGQAFADNNFLIDGIQNNSNHQGWGVMNFPELDAIEEYRVETSVPDARFGRSGGTLNIGYKSGTNVFHGSLFEFLRNDKLDARNFFSAGEKAALRRNQFGGTLGGPIGGKDAKTFFFVSYEGLRNRQGITSVSTVPTALMRSGDFSELLSQATPVRIFDPLTTASNPSGSGLIREPFTNNVIPSAQFDTAGRNVLNFFPDPNGPGLASNLVIAPGESDNRDQATVKIDREFSAGSRGFVRYTQGRTDKENSFNARLGPEATPFVGVEAPIIQGVVSYTHILSPVTINQARYGISRENLRSLSLNGGRNTAEELGIANVNVDPLTTGLSTINVAGYPTLGDTHAAPSIVAMDNYQFSDNLEMIRGNHSLRAGMDVVWRRTNVFQASEPRGAFTFSTIYTSNPAQRANTGFGLSELLLGKPQAIVFDSLIGTRGLRRTDWAWYFQDDWKVTPKLTLNLGLRYDWGQGYPNYEVYDRFSQFDIDTGTFALVGQGEFPERSGIPDDMNNFGPRFGLSYRVTDNTVVRAAYGVYYSFIAHALGATLATQAPFAINSRVENSEADFGGARAMAEGPLRTSDPNAPGLNRSGMDRNFKIPYAQQWNLAIQQQLPGGMQGTIAYVGTKGTDLRQRINFNQAVPGDGAVNLRRRWPQHGAVRIWESRGNSIYHSLQASFVKRYSSGVHYQFAYTWSHLIDDENFSQIPITDLTGARGNGNVDVRHHVRATFGYELPFGRDKQFLTGISPIGDKILGGWQIQGALALYDGIPFHPSSAANTLNIGEGTRPDRIGDGNLPESERTIQRWFDLDAFTNPGFRQFGNAGRNILYGPGTKQLDFSIFKNVSVGEGKRVQFRAEFFNLTNTPQFNNPVSGLSSPAAGVVQLAGAEGTFQRTQRLVQMALKFLF